MFQNFKILLNCLYLVCAFLTAPSIANANGNNTLIISYLTAHANHLPNMVQGVLITPSGDILKTEAMGPFDNKKLTVTNPEDGSYSAYFQALTEIRPKYCRIIGGIDAHLSDQPSVLIPFTPTDSHIQGFTQPNVIRIGDTTLPIATFQLPLGTL